jgi:type I restriction enzyme, S subunit
MIVEQTINRLPKNWKRVKVNDVCINIVGGGTPSTQKSEYWQGDIPWISSADIYGIKDLKPRRKITSEAVKNSATNVLPKGGIVVVTRVGLGKLAVAPYDLCFSQDSQGLILKKDLISTEYALLVLHQEVQNFKHQSRGTTISGVTKKQLSDLEIALPPLDTQQQIVSKIEELFSELDKGIEELKTAQQQLKVYRQAVLKWAFEGRLTNENVKECELPKGWKWTTMNDVCVKIGDIDHKMPKQLPSGYPYVSTKDFTDDLKISFDHTKYISKEDYINLSRKIKPERGDIIFPRYGTIGKNILIDFDKDFLVSYSCAVVKPNQDLVLSKYIYLYSLSPQVTDEIRKYVVETTQANIGIASIKRFVFPLPTKKEQKQIVQEIESRLSVCDKIEETIINSLKQTEALRQSILKKAFEGALI